MGLENSSIVSTLLLCCILLYKSTDVHSVQEIIISDLFNIA